jgi:hypothetical protein
MGCLAESRKLYNEMLETLEQTFPCFLRSPGVYAW